MTWDRVRMTSIYRVWERVLPDDILTIEMKQMIEDVRENQHDWSYNHST